MKAKEKTEKPVLKAGEVFAVVCKKCAFRKERKYFSDARGWQQTHQKSGHAVAIEARKPAPKPKAEKKATEPKAAKKTAKTVAVVKVAKTKGAR